jgi:hypothetical protein
VFAENQALEVRIMKLVQSLVVAAALAIPAVSSFAQSNEAAAPVNSLSGTHQHLRSFRHDVSRLGHKIQGSIRPDANDGMKQIYFGS